MAFYDNMQALASKSITKYGTDVELIDANRAVLDTMKGIMGTINVENVPTSVVEQSTGVISVTVGTLVPEVEHYVNFLGETYKIIHVGVINPAGTPILYQLYVSK